MEQPLVNGRYLVLERPHVADLLTTLQAAGHALVGPTRREGLIVYDHIEQVDDLPIGWTDVQEAGTYRLERRSDDALFGYSVGPDSWKKFLHPSRLTLWSARRKGSGFDIEPGDEAPAKPLALIGVRGCDLAAIAKLDRVLDPPEGVKDSHYVERRRNVFTVAVNCSSPSPTCFCGSMGCGPDARSGYDISLTEVIEGPRHEFVVHVATEAGEKIMSAVPTRPARGEDIAAAGDVMRHAVHNMHRRMPTDGVAEILAKSASHPRWDALAARCLACTNCTVVCPTCYCTTVQDVTDLAGSSASRVRTWDSCFTTDFSYISGGSVRPSVRSRYRHWLTHKLSSWHTQFGSSGCVGCGRCVTWCPAAIDIVEEVEAIRSTDLAVVAAENEKRRTVPMQAVDMRKLLSEHPFLKGMDRRHVDALADCSVYKRFGPGDFLFAEGQEANNSYLIVSGKVELEVYVPGRGPVSVGTVEQGGVIGWSWLMSPFRWHFDAHATQSTEAVVLDGTALRGYCEMWHDLGYELFKRYSVVFQERIESLRIQILDVYGVHAAR